MVEIQWREWQDDLPDGSSPFDDVEGTHTGLPQCGKLQEPEPETKALQQKEGLSPM
jgi:hypothetical protein